MISLLQTGFLFEGITEEGCSGKALSTTQMEQTDGAWGPKDSSIINSG